MANPKFDDCLDCIHYHENNDHICDECMEGEHFDEYIPELDFNFEFVEA